MAVAIAALVLAAGGFAIAAIPSAHGTIHACYKKDGGALRVVKGAGGCRAGERALSWNRGVAKVVVRRGNVVVHLTTCFGSGSTRQCNGRGSGSVSCKGAERATGGGFAGPPDARIEVSRPVPEGGKPTGWTVTAFAAEFGTVTPDVNVPIYVVCAN